MATEPTRLKGNGATRCGPVRAISRGANAAACILASVLRDPRDKRRSIAQRKLTWVHPLHAVGVCVVGDEIVAAPSRIADDNVRRRDASQDQT
jgi:hypothetical protein